MSNKGTCAAIALLIIVVGLICVGTLVWGPVVR
jgi:hypothetical protein